MRTLLLLIFAISPGYLSAVASENPGVTAAPVLQIPLGGRAVGMGTAFTAVASDLSTLYYNPAGLSNLRHREISTMYLQGLEDQDIEYVALGSPLPFTGVLGNGYATLGASLLFSQNGDIEVNRTRPDGSFLDSRKLDAGGDFVATLGYSERIAEFSIDTKQGSYNVHHFMGLSGKFIRSTLAQSYSAIAYATDIGYLATCPQTGLSFGAALLNFGSRMRFIEEADPLPVGVRAGLSYFLPLDAFAVPSWHALTLAADGDYMIHERQWHTNIGAEYSVLRLYALRAGYQFQRDVVGFTLGFGVKWMGFEVDYAWGLNDVLSNTHRFMFTYRFGRVPLQKREQIRKPFIERVPEGEELKGLEDQAPQPVDTPQRPRAPGGEILRSAPGWIY